MPALEQGAEQAEFQPVYGTERLVGMFEAAEMSGLEARKNAERDRDYYDGKQLSADELAALAKRKQPAVIINRIKRKVDFLVGLEKQQRVAPRCLPRTPIHQDDADSASQAIREVTDTQRYAIKRSAAWRNMLVEGACGMRVGVKPGRDGYDITIDRVAWDRMFWDPFSAELDFSDANYLGVVLWLDHDDAMARYPGKEDIIAATYSGQSNSDTYDDKPKHDLWSDKARKRVRVCQMWCRHGDDWHLYEFTRGGILTYMPSPYFNDAGESEPDMIFRSAFSDRDNARYGAVREMISPQDETNKRRSKALHLLNVSQLVIQRGAVDSIEKARAEAARPDGVIEIAPNMTDGFSFNTRSDLATAHFQLMQEAKAEIDMMGPNAAMQGEAAGGTSSASGKAIIASQQGGMIQLGDLLDGLRDLDIRVFRAVWARIRQFWTAEKWIRVTDDERNIRWVVMNASPEQVQYLVAANPQLEGIVRAGGRVAQLDVDIIIDEQPDGVTPALEQWQGLVDLAKAGVPIPPDVLIEAAPNLKNKERLLERMNQPNPAAQMQQDQAARANEAKIAVDEATAAEKQAKAMQAAGGVYQPAQILPPPGVLN